MAEVLEAQTGRDKGSRPAGRLRREGSVPGVLYGLGMEPVAVAVEWPALRRALNADGGVSAAIRLRVDGKEHLTLVKELQRHPVRRDVIHVDFLAVDPDELVNVEITLVLAGVEALPTALQDQVVLITHRLEVTSKPGAIPAEVPLDVSGLVEGGEIKVSDLRLPPGVTTHADPDLVLATIMGDTPMDAELEASDAAAAEAESEAAAEDEGGAAEGKAGS
jgi:large subunit ribosomal protein L25